MGCGQSDISYDAPTPRNNRRPKKTGPSTLADAPITPISNSSVMPPVSPPQTTKEAASNSSFPGKQKYIGDAGAIVMEINSGGGPPEAIVLAFVPEDSDVVLTFTYRDMKNGALYFKDFTASQLQKEKDAANITHAWAPVFKAIASDLLKGKAFVDASNKPHWISLEVQVTSTKDPKEVQPFRVRLELRKARESSLLGCSNVLQRDSFHYFLEPFARMVQKRRQTVNEKELHIAQLECQSVVREVLSSKDARTVAKLTPLVPALRNEAADRTRQSALLLSSVTSAEKRLRFLRNQKESKKHPLDQLYENGGAQHFDHIHEADDHQPVEQLQDTQLAQWMRARFPLPAGESCSQLLTPRFAVPPCQKLLLQQPKGETAIRILQRLDEWDFNVFELEKATDNAALFHVTYALLHKMDLVREFNIDDKILRNFLAAMQAGYHPNPYHNATHAADVAQINYFIIVRAGLESVCGLKRHQLFAAILAGAMHDFDHPGFNNNFHTRTNAFLSTLYNDKSILENHHLASIFEMVRNPRYDIFASFEEKQRAEVRETMIEMVLATDMGNHGKYYSAFRRKLQEAHEWKSDEEVKLALEMSIKMADISNCARPSNIYLEWVKCIACEFFNQGDAELKGAYGVSPFMDRRKEKTEFPRGQTSFMNFVVIPTLESLAEVLPSLDFALQYCTKNKAYWESMGGENAV